MLCGELADHGLREEEAGEQVPGRLEAHAECEEEGERVGVRDGEAEDGESEIDGPRGERSLGVLLYPDWIGRCAVVVVGWPS